MIAYLFPGQGSQQKGMGAKLFDIFQDLSEMADAILGYSVEELCLRDPENRLNHTQYTQPALYVVNAFSYLYKLANSGEWPTYLAGHSLGEYNALFAAGAFDFETGLRLVKRRAELMAQAEGGGMMAVVGTDHRTIEKTLADHRLAGIDIAGLNAPSQTVISGPSDELVEFERHFKSSKTVSCIPLRVNAAFHSRYMADARKQFAAFLETIRFSDIRIPVIANATAAPYQNGRIGQLLCDQITHCVRWEETVRYIGGQGDMRFEEIGPGRVLTGMLKQIDPTTAPDRKTPPTPSTASMFMHGLHPKRVRPQVMKPVDDTKSTIEAVGNVSPAKRGRGQQARQSMLKEEGDAADIAIIGIACRFPGAKNYHQYWHNLERGINSIREITPDRWDIDKYYSPDVNEPNKSISKWCGLVDDIDKFDNSFFNISPREAKNMDPQQRLLLEETWRCVEDSGVNLDELRQKRTAVYVGVIDTDYRQEAVAPGYVTDSYAVAGNYDAMLANRISYIFGFTGASVCVEAACASSLVAINGAKRSLLIGESDYAIAGGVNLNLHPWKYFSLSKARMLSPEGQCKPFDAEANGYVSGDGVGLLLMQRLEDALAAGNPIWGVIKGSAVNHGGRTQSFTAPRVEAQRDVILLALNEAKINPRTVSYIEAHGTGTSLGDPIEVEALTRAFRRFTDENDFCKIGSVKSNIGHLEASAAVASVIKVLLMMKHRKIPKSLNIKQINPIIHFDSSPFSLARELTDWVPKSDDDIPLRAGVSSFGMGGVNAHIVLEQAPSLDSAKDTRHGQLFVLSAKSRDSLNRMLVRWKSFVASEQFSQLNFKDICWTMLTGRDSLPFRFGVYAEDKNALKEMIAAAARSAVAVQPSEKFYCLRIGSLNIDGYSRIEPLLRNETVFSECLRNIRIDLHKLTETCQSFKALNMLQELSSGFEQDNWTPAAQRVFAFMVDYAYAAALIKIGAAPGLITGGKEGALAGLASCGIIRPMDALALLTQQTEPQEISLRRPKLPFLDPVSGKIIEPFRFSDEYVRFIRNELRVDPDLLEYYLEKGQLLFKGQFTFKRYMQEWNSILEGKGKSVEQMLFDHVGNAPFDGEGKREKILILVIIISSLHKLRLKWDLTQQKPIVDQLLSEVVDLIVDDVMSKQVLVQLFMVDQPDFKDIASALSKNYHQMDLSKPYHYIRTQNHGLKEIEDVPEWLTRLTTSMAPLPQIENMVCADLGESDSLTKAIETVTFQTSKDLDRSFKEFLLQLWLHGVHIEWPTIFPDGQFNKVPLPGYAFDRKSYWLNRAVSDNLATPAPIQEPAAPLPKEEEKERFLPTSQPNNRSDRHRHQDHRGAANAKIDPVLGDTRVTEMVSGDTLLFRKIWEQSKARLGVGSDITGNDASGNLLLFDVDESLRNAFQRKREDLGEDTRTVLVLPGERYRRQDASTYIINPAKEKDYRKLIEALIEENVIPGHIVHMWSGSGSIFDESALHRQLRYSIYSLLHLTRELMLQAVEGKIKLLHVYRSLNGEIQPQHSSVSGFFKSVMRENPRIACKTVEICRLRETSPPPTPLQLSDIILGELHIDSATDTAVRYKDDTRWVSRYSRIALPQAIPDMPSFRQGGVYLITGGAGGLGLIFAEYLAQNVNAKIVLAGRSDLNCDIQEKIRRIGRSGAELRYVKADVSRREDVKHLVESVKSEFSTINGIIHAAGVVRHSFLIKKDPAEIKAVLDPKTFGTVFLDQATQHETLDFFVLFSSISGAIGSAGLCDYAYGNSFMDSFSEERERLRDLKMRSGKTISINWPLWRHGGMQISSEEEKIFSDSTGFKALPTKEGIRCFLSALQSNVNQCVVGFGDSMKIKNVLMRLQSTEEKSKMIHSVHAENRPLISKTEGYLAKVICKLLELAVEDIDPHVSFNEYGVDSIMIHHFNAVMGKDFKSLSKTLLFEYQTIHDLAAYMARNHEPELCLLFGVSADKNHAAETIASPDPQGIEVSGAAVAAEPRPAVPSPGAFESQRPPAKQHTRILQRGMISDTCAPTSDGAAATGHSAPGLKTVHQPDDGIAVIGLSGTYPGAKNLDEFWHNLKSGKDCVTEIPQSRWPANEFYDQAPEKADQGKMYCKWGAFLDDVEMFDPLFFNISPKEAELMDPQERLFLETAWHTLEDAGYTSRYIRALIEKKKSADVGVFVGVTSNTYLMQGAQHWTSGSMPIPATVPWSIANRVSYMFNFHGPSMPVDTACASSLTAVHMACESIRNGECLMAIAGGVNLYLHPFKYVWMCQLGMLSSQGRCASFGDGADGFVPGEGVGAVLLKSFKEAVQDGDNIYAVIKGSAVNHGGLMHEYMVPNPNAQAQLISKAMDIADYDPGTIGYLEAQGIGSELADAIEISGLQKAYRGHTKKRQYCAIGSVKSNIGHLEAAAGIAGLTKVLLQMKHKQLAPSLHANRVNPGIDFETSPFFIQRELTPWENPVIYEKGQQREIPRRAGVSSFGAGGINAHVVLEAYEPGGIQGEPLTAAPSRQLFVLSAKNEQRLKSYAGELSRFLETYASDPKRHLSIENVAYTLQVGREPMDARLAIIADTPRDLCRQLDSYAGTSSAAAATNTFFTNFDENSANPIIQDLAKGQFGQDFIELVTTHLDLRKLALLWIAGTDIPWERIHKDRHVRRVSLPTYPFERQRCWICGTSEFTEPQEAKRQRITGFTMHPEKKPESQDAAPDPMRQTLVQWISELLKIPESVLEEDRNLREYGFNSLAGMRMIHRIAERFDVMIPPSKLFEHQTIAALSKFLAARMEPTDGLDGSKVNTAPELTADRIVGEKLMEDIDVDRLSDGEVENLIMQLLRHAPEHSVLKINRMDKDGASSEQLSA